MSCDKVFELRFAHPDWVALQTRQAGLEGTGEIRLHHLVKESLRMRPSRLVVGEVRGEKDPRSSVTHADGRVSASGTGAPSLTAQ